MCSFRYTGEVLDGQGEMGIRLTRFWAFDIVAPPFRWIGGVPHSDPLTVSAAAAFDKTADLRFSWRFYWTTSEEATAMA
jgi:hypothetical protein